MRLDPVAFLRDDYDAFRGRLDTHGVAHSPMNFPRSANDACSCTRWAAR